MDEFIRQAYALAFYLHGDADTAARITVAALAKLAVASAAQDKRLYYTPTGRAQARKARNKVSFDEPHLLQRLVYIESEPFEREKEEQRETLCETDLLIFFIKHLVKITVRRNSFYVTLGVSRVLHNYSTSETMEFYNLVMQDPDRIGEESYYRAAKGRVMQEVKERFGTWLTIARGQRGEERFLSQENASPFTELIRDSLQHFTPWMTKCVVPQNFTPLDQDIPALTFADSDPDGEHCVEVRRIHSILHPDCFERLAMALQYEPPGSRLEVPKFAISASGHEPPPNRRPPDPLDDRQLDFIKGVLAEQSAQRRSARAGLLRIVVDGREQVVMNLRTTSRAQLHLDDRAELIEVYGEGERGEVLLATHLLAEESGAIHRSITLEAGQRIVFDIDKPQGAQSDGGEVIVAVSYSETYWARAAAFFIQQQAKAMTARWPSALTHQRAFKPLLAGIALAVALVGMWIFLPSSPTKLEPEIPLQAHAPSGETDKPIIMNPQTDTLPALPQQSGTGASSPQPRATPKRIKNRRDAQLARHKEAVSEGGILSDETDAVIVSDLRGNRARLDTLSLHEVRTICLSVRGDERLGNQLLAAITARLQSSRRVSVTRDRETADAMLRLNLTQEGQQSSMQVMLLDASGLVIWNPQARSAKIDSVEQSAAQVAADLLESLQRADRAAQKNRR